MAATVVEKAFCVLELMKTNSVFSEDDMANLHLHGSLSTIGARHFKKLVVYAKVKVLGDHQNPFATFMGTEETCISDT